MHIHVVISAQDKCFRKMICRMLSGITISSVMQKCREFILVGEKNVFVFREIDY